MIDYGWDSRLDSPSKRRPSTPWQASQWTLPLEAGVSQLVTLAGWFAEIELTGLYFVVRASDDATLGYGARDQRRFGN